VSWTAVVDETWAGLVVVDTSCTSRHHLLSYQAPIRLLSTQRPFVSELLRITPRSRKSHAVQ